MRTIVVFAIISLFGMMSGCNNPVNRQLAKAEAVMESAPDSALAILDSIDNKTIISSSTLAHYSLLKAIALDKNYIDTTDISIIQPAIDYYSHNGTPDEKLRAYYYQGRILQNAGDEDAAMGSFLHGLESKNDCSDSLTLAHLFVAQSLIFTDLYDFDMAVSNYLYASNLYKAIGHNSEYVDCVLNALNISELTNNDSLTDSLYRSCVKELNQGNINKDDFLPYELSYISELGTKEELLDILEKYASIPISDGNTLLTIANSYHKIGETKKALAIIDQLKLSEWDYDSLKYHAIMASLLEDIKDYRGALDEYKSYNALLSEIHLAIFEHKSKLDKERYLLELEAERTSKEKISLLWATGLFITILVTGIIILLLKNRNSRTQKDLAIQKEKTAISENEKLKTDQAKLELEKENLMLRVSSLEIEREQLNESLNSNSELPIEVQNTIKERVEMLNSLFASQITSDFRHEKPYNKWVNELLADAESFMNSTRLAFQVSHPKFIRYFEEHGLSIDEINYLCLYAIGLKGKEVGTYIKKTGHVNISSAIRKKLGLDRHETNIGIYVRRLLKNL